MDNNINFYKGIKTIVALISGIAFFVNIFFVSSVMSISSFVFIFTPSAMLTVYGMQPVQGKRKYARKIVFYILSSQFVFSMVAILLIVHWGHFSWIILTLKILLTVSTVFYIGYAVIDDTNYETPLEKETVIHTRGMLEELDKKRHYRYRKRHEQYNQYIKETLQKKIKPSDKKY